jgi:predicted enzyme related to lactoylglutathione lyase
MSYNKSIFILYVKDLLRSKKFYERVLNAEPVLDVPGMTEFSIGNSALLGLMTETGISKILGNSVPHPESGNGIPRCEIYLFVDNPDEYIERLASAGGKLISKSRLRDWGDEAAYGMDPDGHIIAFAKKAGNN